MDGQKSTLTDVCKVITVTINTYFLMNECLQFSGAKLDYFHDTENLFDIIRIGTVYMHAFAFELSLSTHLSLLMYLALQIKCLLYLMLFDSNRYLIIMIFEILKDCRSFLLILVISMLAYA